MTETELLEDWMTLGDICRELAEKKRIELEDIDPEKLYDGTEAIPEFRRFKDICDKETIHWSALYGKNETISINYLLGKSDFDQIINPEVLLIKDVQRRIFVELNKANATPAIYITDKRAAEARKVLNDGLVRFGSAGDIKDQINKYHFSEAKLNVLHPTGRDIQPGFPHVRDCLLYLLAE